MWKDIDQATWWLQLFTATAEAIYAIKKVFSNRDALLSPFPISIALIFFTFLTVLAKTSPLPWARMRTVGIVTWLLIIMELLWVLISLFSMMLLSAETHNWPTNIEQEIEECSALHWTLYHSYPLNSQRSGIIARGDDWPQQDTVSQDTTGHVYMCTNSTCVNKHKTHTTSTPDTILAGRGEVNTNSHPW